MSDQEGVHLVGPRQLRTETQSAVPLRVPPNRRLVEAPPNFPAWVAETYEALAHIQNLRHTPPRQLATTEPVERKCSR